MFCFLLYSVATGSPMRSHTHTQVLTVHGGQHSTCTGLSHERLTKESSELRVDPLQLGLDPLHLQLIRDPLQLRAASLFPQCLRLRPLAAMLAMAEHEVVDVHTIVQLATAMTTVWPPALAPVAPLAWLRRSAASWQDTCACIISWPLLCSRSSDTSSRSPHR